MLGQVCDELEIDDLTSDRFSPVSCLRRSRLELF